MSQNATPAGPQARPAKPPVGRLKRDINLLPANRDTEKLIRNTVILVLVVAGLAVLAFFAVVMPAMGLMLLQNDVKSAKEQLGILERNGSAFQALVARRDALLAMEASLENGAKSSLHPADVFKAVGGTCPVGIELTALTIDAAGVTIDGRAVDDGQIAQFIVNLKTLPFFAQVSLVDVTQDEQEDAPIARRIFQVTAALPQAAAPEPTATQAPEGGDGQ